MNFHECRICRSKNNLRHIAADLEKLYYQTNGSKNKNEKVKPILADATLTVGNICYNCEEQMLNFHELDDDDVDIDSTHNLLYHNNNLSSRIRTQEDAPVIVDDDALLYKLFMKKVCDKRQRGKIIRSHQHHQQQKEQKCASTTAITATTTSTIQKRSSAHSELSQHSLESDGDTEIIELLTSRENTPSPNVKCEQRKKRQKTSPTTTITTATAAKIQQQEKQTFDLDNDSNHKSIINLTRPKNISKDFTVIASLSLLSSDSEQDDSDLIKLHPKTTEMNGVMHCFNTQSLTTTTTETTKILPARIDQMTKTSEIPSVKTSSSTTTSTNTTASIMTTTRTTSDTIITATNTDAIRQCPACCLIFNTDLELIHHLRAKHRSNSDKNLREQSRQLNDSAMTIRLRFRQRQTYYECQLCGRIDNILRDHKLHIIDSHAAESRSLRDPQLLANLKCPICKIKCGEKYNLLCQHMRNVHKANEYNQYLPEIRNICQIDWVRNKSIQKQILKTARIFQYSIKKMYFFECRICRHFADGYNIFKEHLHSHNIDIVDDDKNISNQTTEKKKNNHKLNVTNCSVQKQKSLKDCCKKTEKTDPQKRTYKSVRKAMPPPEISPTTSHKATKSVIITGKQKLKRAVKRPVNGHIVMNYPPLPPPPIQIPTQSYTCQICLKVFNGFYCWNLHHFNEHADVIDMSSFSLDHVLISKDIAIENKNIIGKVEMLNKRKIMYNKRKHKEIVLDENCNNSKLPTTTTVQVNNNSNDTGILEAPSVAIIKTKKPKTTKRTKPISYSITTDDSLHDSTKQQTVWQPAEQCGYCTGLFKNKSALHIHEMRHIKRNDMVIIKRRAFNTTN